MEYQGDRSLLGSSDPVRIRAAIAACADQLYDFALLKLAHPQRASLAVHNALVVGHVRAATVTDTALFTAWLYALVRDECQRLSWPPSKPVELLRRDGADLPIGVRFCLEQFHEDEREVLELAVRHQLEIEELANVVGDSPRRVRRVAEATRERLAESSADNPAGHFAQWPMFSAPPQLADRVLGTLADAQASERIAGAAGPWGSDGFPLGHEEPSVLARWRRPVAIVAATVAVLAAGYAIAGPDTGSSRSHLEPDRAAEHFSGAGDAVKEHPTSQPTTTPTPSPTPSPTPVEVTTPTSSQPAVTRGAPTQAPAPSRAPASPEPTVKWADIRDASSSGRCGTTFWAQVKVGVDHWDQVDKIVAYIWTSEQAWEVPLRHVGGEEGRGEIELPRNTTLNYIIAFRTKSGKNVASEPYRDSFSNSC